MSPCELKGDRVDFLIAGRLNVIRLLIVLFQGPEGGGQLSLFAGKGVHIVDDATKEVPHRIGVCRSTGLEKFLDGFGIAEISGHRAIFAQR